MTLTTRVKASIATRARIRVDVYDPAGHLAFRKTYAARTFKAGVTVTVKPAFYVSTKRRLGTYVVKVRTLAADRHEDPRDEDEQPDVPGPLSRRPDGHRRVLRGPLTPPSSSSSGVRKRGVIRTGPSQRVESIGLGLDGGRALRPDVLEEPDRDLAVGALAPAADDPAVGPDRRPGVPVRVEQRRPMLAEVPVAVGPAHDRRVEGREEGHRGRAVVRPIPVMPALGLDIVGEDPAPAVVELDLDRPDLGQRPADLGDRPAGPPLEVANRAGTEAASQRRTSSSRAAAFGSSTSGPDSHASIRVQR